MAERRKSRKRKDQDLSHIDAKKGKDKPSKEEYAVAKWIRNNVPSKKTKFDRNHNVEYFTGSRAVDALLESSPWSKNKFETREQVTEFLDVMLRHKFFHRAKKVVIPEEELSKIRGIKKKVKEVKEEKKETKEKEDTKESKDGKDVDEKGEEKKEQKKKPKVRLEMHLEQCFVDCNDAYVWIYEPTPIYYWFFGTLVVLGAIGLCLFPLWPSTIRNGVYYLSVAAAGFLVFLLALIVIRMIVFCLLWIPTFGRCHFWILPNLTADVGFFASFWPLYQYNRYDLPSDREKRTTKKKSKKEKDSDNEETVSSQSTEKSSSTISPKGDVEHIEDVTTAEEKKGTNEAQEGEEVSEGSESEKSNTGRDFVML